MYAHCLFCNADLGRNEAIEAFTVGRRLAYDADKGRLWVVCTACTRWNLTPLEERWEAIEQAERTFRGARLRASTANIGCTRLDDGTELIRVGRPLFPEFAAWRYGRQLTARQWRYFVRGAPMAVVGTAAGVAVLSTFGATMYALNATIAGGTGVAGVLTTMGVSAAVMHGADRVLGRVERAARRVTVGDATTIAARVQVAGSSVARLVVRRGHLAESAFRGAKDGALVLDLRHDDGRAEFRGADAQRVAALVAPTLNAAGAGTRVVADAVRSIASRGGPAAYLALAGRWIGRSTEPMTAPPARWSSESRIPGNAGLYALRDVQRLALEMALHEESERRALDGELAELERAWRDAEEIAAIADSLVLPAGVEDAWTRLRARITR